MGSKDLGRFLFELASDERLAILESISVKPRKHAEIARTLSMTGSETTRHLNRLIGAGLVTKDPEGRFVPTGLAEALQAGLPLLEFLTDRRPYLLGHRVSVLEPPFLERLGELRRATFELGTYQVVAVQESSLRTARRRIWVVTEQRFEQALPILREKAAQAADVRVIRSRRFLEDERRSRRDVSRNFPVRVLPEVPLFLAVLDDRAGICLPSNDGKVDMATMLLATDADGCRWAEDLFLSLWNRAAVWHAPLG